MIRRSKGDYWVVRPLEANEIVHHRDGNGKNNAIDNLELMSQSEHAKRHHKPLTVLVLECAWCGGRFERAWNQRPEIKGQVNAYCSRRCSGSATRLLQMERTIQRAA